MKRRSQAPSTGSAPAAGSTAAAGRRARGLFGLACLCVLGLAAFAGSGAPSAGAVLAFPGQGFLPDNRAWELVSPAGAGKNGADIAYAATRTRAAADGSAVMFGSTSAFADAIGTGPYTEYIAKHSTDPAPGDNGWSTHAITPAQESQTFATPAAGEVAYEREFSADLSKGVFHAWSPLTDDPMVAEAANLYLRDDLLDPGPGSYQLVSACPLCVAPLNDFSKQQKQSVAGASEDFAKVVFESSLNLAQGASGSGKKAYEWDEGSLRFAGVLPNGGAAARSIAGSGIAPGGGGALRNLLNPVSSDGLRVVFTVPPTASSLEGPLYSRIDGRSTVQLNASERATPDSPQPALYWAAAPANSRVFFTTQEALTDDTPVGGGAKLYMWERADHNETQQLAVDAGTGTITLGFNGHTTAPIAFDAPAATVQSALEALIGPAPLSAPVIGAGNVTVSGGPGSPGAATPYQITFAGDFAGANVAEVSADASGLGGGTATVTTTQPVQNLTYINDPTGAPDPLSSAQGVLGVSDDGSHLYFAATGQLVPGEPALGGDFGLYHWHEGEIDYVGELTDFGLVKGLMPGTLLSAQKLISRVSASGNLVFPARSGEGLLSAHGGIDRDHAGLDQLYAYRADTEELFCMSCAPDSPSIAAANNSEPSAPAGGAFGTYQNRALSADGRYAFFSTAEKLVKEDSNGVSDAYVFDITMGQARLLSSGEDPNPSYFLEASAGGEDVFFATRGRLSGWDVDNAYDLYDARVGGGFPEPPPPAPACEGDACQPAPLTLADPTPASSSFTGAGDPKGRRVPSRACPRGKRKVRRAGRTRCVKRPARKRTGKQNRAANTNGRTGR